VIKLAAVTSVNKLLCTSISKKSSLKHDCVFPYHVRIRRPNDKVWSLCNIDTLVFCSRGPTPPTPKPVVI
jgi:hypothetical protein